MDHRSFSGTIDKKQNNGLHVGAQANGGTIMIPTYIGYADVYDTDLIRTLYKSYMGAGGPATKRRLCVGVKTSYDILNQRKDGFMRPRKIASMFFDNSHMFNVLHYLDYQHKDLTRYIGAAINAGGPFLEAIQLHMNWPDIEQVRKTRIGYPHLALMLRINGFSLISEGDVLTPQELAQKIRAYRMGIDAIVFDLDKQQEIFHGPQDWRPYIQAVKDACPDYQIVIAQAAGPNTLRQMEELKAHISSFSLDLHAPIWPTQVENDFLQHTPVEELFAQLISLFKT